MLSQPPSVASDGSERLINAGRWSMVNTKRWESETSPSGIIEVMYLVKYQANTASLQRAGWCFADDDVARWWYHRPSGNKTHNFTYTKPRPCTRHLGCDHRRRTIESTEPSGSFLVLNEQGCRLGGAGGSIATRFIITARRSCWSRKYSAILVVILNIASTCSRI